MDNIIGNLIDAAKDKAKELINNFNTETSETNSSQNTSDREILTDNNGEKYSKCSILQGIVVGVENNMMNSVDGSFGSWGNIDFGTYTNNYQGGIISIDKLLQIFPKANRNYASACLEALDRYGTAVGLNDKGKLMVLAQFAVESGRFIYTAELGKGRGRKYGVPSGPYGKIYYGRGPIQITWESNYKKIAQEIFPKMGLNADIWADPDLCERNLLIGCAASLAWFMLPGNGRRAVQCANNGDVDGLSKAINSGWNGIEHRREYTQKIFQSI